MMMVRISGTQNKEHCFNCCRGSTFLAFSLCCIRTVVLLLPTRLTRELTSYKFYLKEKGLCNGRRQAKSYVNEGTESLNHR